MDIKTIETMRTANGMLIITTVDADPPILGELVAKANMGGYELTIAPKKHPRSLDANAYYWLLLDKLASAIKTSKEELHSIMLDRYGLLREREDGSITVFTIRTGIDPKEVTPYCRQLKRIEKDGKDFTVYGVLKGSSEMNSKEFSTLLDGVISECKEQGIETMTPAELERLKGYEQQSERSEGRKGIGEGASR